VPEPRSTSGNQRGGKQERPSVGPVWPPISKQLEKLDGVTPGAVPSADAAPVEPNLEPSSAERLHQVNLILDSRSFRNAPLLRKFLQFITSESALGKRDDLSEYVIATQVFGRPSSFDPASDTIVRTQAYRLRTKLKEYYETEGKKEQVIVQVPKGHYAPSFSFRKESGPELVEDETGQHISAVEELKPPAGSKRLMVMAAFVVVALAFIGGVVAGRRWFPQRTPLNTPQIVPEPLASFWRDFAGGREVLIAYTSAAFFETENGDLLRFHHGQADADRGSTVGKGAISSVVDPALVTRAGPLYYEKGFTGTGEVLAASRLTSLLTQLGASVRIKRSELITVDDLQSYDIIFLGSPWGNRLLEEWNTPRRFSFQMPPKPPLLWKGVIVDAKPSSGSTRSYATERDPETQVIRAEYALFDVLPGRAPGRRIIVLAGLSTTGTEGAAEFATSADGLRHIMDLEGSAQKTDAFPRYFEALLRVEAEKGLEAINVKYVDGSVVATQQ
jgi:hypothetical protein